MREIIISLSCEYPRREYWLPDKRDEAFSNEFNYHWEPVRRPTPELLERLAERRERAFMGRWRSVYSETDGNVWVFHLVLRDIDEKKTTGSL